MHFPPPPTHGHWLWEPSITGPIGSNLVKKQQLISAARQWPDAPRVPTAEDFLPSWQDGLCLWCIWAPWPTMVLTATSFFQTVASQRQWVFPTVTHFCDLISESSRWKCYTFQRLLSRQVPLHKIKLGMWISVNCIVSVLLLKCF